MAKLKIDDIPLVDGEADLQSLVQKLAAGKKAKQAASKTKKKGARPSRVRTRSTPCPSTKSLPSE